MKDNHEKINQYLDGIAEFLHKYVPDYTELAPEALASLEHIWLAISTNRVEFIKVLDKVKPTRKKRVAK